MLRSDIFSLLQHICFDAFSININYFPSLSGDISEIDNQLRNRMQNSTKLYDSLREVIRDLKLGTICHITDQLSLSYIVFPASSDADDFYSIGPFSSTFFSENDFLHIQLNNNLKNAQLSEIKSLLQIVPCGITWLQPLSIAKNMLNYIHPMDDYIITEVHLNKDTTNSNFTPTDNSNSRIHQIENIYQHESRLLEYVAEGKTNKAIEETLFFLQSKIDRRLSNIILSKRSLLFSVNTLLRKTAQNIGVHPIYLDEISSRYSKHLASCSNSDQLNEINIAMVSDYCKLCRDHSCMQYSENTQKIINYVLFHLSEKLTITQVSADVNFSPSYISRLFRKEVGISLVSFITQQRVKIAKEMFSTTSMSVQDVSSYVGISDFNYFTKVFKKETGLTPSQYRHNLMN